MMPGDWICTACQNHNFASRTVCNRCQNPKEAGAPASKGGYGAAPKAPIVRPSPLGAIGAPEKPVKQPPNMKDGDWLCAACGNHNFASRVACNKCSAPKTSTGGSCGGGKPQTPAKPANMKDGDWFCNACGNHNFASRTACNRCNAPKIGAFGSGGSGAWGCDGKGGSAMGKGFGGFDGGYGPYMGMGYMMPAMPMMMGGNGAMMMGGKGGIMKEGDWLCPQCSNHNYASRVNCNKCSALKPGAKSGDWICRACRNHNFASRTECNKCKEPKPQNAY